MSAIDFISDKLYPVAQKLATQRHLLAIRDAFISTMALTMAASFGILLNALIFSNAAVNKVIDLSSFASLVTYINDATFGILSIVVCYNVGSNLCKWYIDNSDMNGSTITPAHAGMMAVASLFALMPLTSTVTLANGKTASGIASIISQTYTSSDGLFVAMFAALISTEILVRLARSRHMRISMPDGVPPAIATTFNSMIPEILVIMIFAIFAFALDQIFHMSFTEIIGVAIQTPLKGFVLSAGGLFFLQFISDFLWAFGLHGASILSPIKSAPLLQAIQENVTAFQNHAHIPNIITQPFIDSNTLSTDFVAIVIAIFLFSKRQDQRQVGKLASIPAFFNISEPLMFGLPIVLNPAYMIPIILVPQVNLGIAYFATSVGLIGKTVAMAPWITPPILQNYLVTGGNIPAAILGGLLIVIDVVIWMPFVMISNRTGHTEPDAQPEK